MKSYRFQVVESPFHGGNTISTHRTAKGAALALFKRLAGVECQCGCAHIVDTKSAWPGPPVNVYSRAGVFKAEYQIAPGAP